MEPSLLPPQNTVLAVSDVARLWAETWWHLGERVVGKEGPSVGICQKQKRKHDEIHNIQSWDITATHATVDDFSSYQQH